MTAMVDDVVAFCRLFAMHERDAVCGGSVTVPQCVILQTLLEGEWDVSSLAAGVGVTNGAMTRLLDGLEKKDFIERVRDDVDRRRVAVVLTAGGRREAKRLRALTHEAVTLIMSQVPREKRTQVAEAVGMLRRAVESARSTIKCC